MEFITKSKQKGPNMDCDKCVFNIRDDGPPMSGGPFGGGQVGCKADRLQKFIDKGKATREGGASSYELTQFCNMYRTDEWEGDLDKAISETKPMFGVIINSSDSNIDLVKKSLDSIKSVNYVKNYVKVVISMPHLGKQINELMHMVNEMVKLDFHCEFVLHLTDDPAITEKSAFQKIYSAGYFVYMEAGEELDPDFFNYVDKSVNEKLDMVCMFEDGGISICHQGVVNSIYLECKGYKDMLNRLRDESKQKGVYDKYQR